MVWLINEITKQACQTDLSVIYAPLRERKRFFLWGCSYIKGFYWYPVNPFMVLFPLLWVWSQICDKFLFRQFTGDSIDLIFWLLICIFLFKREKSVKTKKNLKIIKQTTKSIQIQINHFHEVSRCTILGSYMALLSQIKKSCDFTKGVFNKTG